MRLSLAAAVLFSVLVRFAGADAPELPAVANANRQAPDVKRDGQHDFDFEIGTWNTHLKRLLKPLTGSTTWVEYDGTTVVRKVWDGRANLVELKVDGPAGSIEALSLRLYNPQTRQWSLNFSGSGSGSMSVPTVGEFRNGRGEFYDQETLNGRAILVRFVIFDITETSCRFEQAFSDDGGKTWEVNWIATDTRTPDQVEALPPDLVKAAKEYDDAQVAKDLRVLARLIADDYVLVNSDASVQNKTQVLADHRLPGFKIDPFVMENALTRVWGAGAVVSGMVNLSWTQDGKRQRRLIRLANTWALRHGDWQLVYTQVTRVP